MQATPERLGRLLEVIGNEKSKQAKQTSKKIPNNLQSSGGNGDGHLPALCPFGLCSDRHILKQAIDVDDDDDDGDDDDDDGDEEEEEEQQQEGYAQVLLLYSRLRMLANAFSSP